MKNWRARTELGTVVAAQYGAGGCGALLEQTLPGAVRQRPALCACKGKRILVAGLLAGLIMKGLSSSEMASLAQTNADLKMEWLEEDDSLPDHREYAAAFEARYPEAEIRVGAQACVGYEENGVETAPVLYTDYAGKSGSSVYTGSHTSILFAVEVEEEGFYDLALEYYPLEGSGGKILRSILIDGKQPYRELGRVEYDRIWSADGWTEPEEKGQKEREADGHSEMTQKPAWIVNTACDSLSVHLTEGEHTISIVSLAEPMLIHQVILRNEKPAQAYDEVKAFWDAVGIRAAGSHPIHIEAEHMKRASSQMLYPMQEQTSQETGMIRTRVQGAKKGNVISGESWEEAGQWAEWEFDVEEAGYYHLALCDCQNYVKNGVYRKIMIDGMVPFAEMEGYCFPYGRSWRKEMLSDEAGTPYVFFLKKGHHTLRMEVVLGDRADVVSEVYGCLRQINSVCSRMDRAGGMDEAGREKQLRSLREELTKVSGQLERTAGRVQELTGRHSGGTKVMTALKSQLDKLIEEESDLADGMKELGSSMHACRNWADGFVLQPLAIDYINIVSADAEKR